MKKVYTIILRSALAMFAFGMLPGFSALGQEEFYHPELEWKTIETEHFLIHYHNGAERTGRVVARIAEDIYEPVTSLYGHRPDGKVSFIIRDHDDISNGAAYFYDNKVEIYAPSMDFDLRGTHNWLRNVVTHEFTHIVQIQTTMKFGRRMPGFYLQWLGYESERRPDVLYGFPNVIVSYPYSGFVVPVWFAEGVAQHNRGDLRYDFWDSHRDMILRSYALDNNMLTWEQMGVFGKTSLGNESSYNAGFAFVQYVARKYGEEKLAEISRNLSRFTAATIDGAIEKALGKTGKSVYDEWRDEVKENYSRRTAPVVAQLREGSPIPVLKEDGTPEVAPAGNRSFQHHLFQKHDIAECCAMAMSTGFANTYPVYSRDGGKIAYVTTKQGDYFSQASLFVYDVETKKEQRIRGGIRTGVSWSPDGNKVYYGRTSRDNPHWSLQFDLYEYDIEKEKEARLTFGKRALSPAVSPDGTTIACVVGTDGTSNLALVNSDGSHFRLLTHYANGEQVYTPQWSPDGSLLVFDYSIKDGRDIATIRSDGTDIRFLLTGDDDSRSAVFTRDGTGIVFSSDRTGIFNLYSYQLSDGAVKQVTNVLGGAFMPTVNPRGDIVYASYTSGGYKIVRMESPGSFPDGNHDYLPDQRRTTFAELDATGSNGKSAPVDWTRLRSYDDTALPPVEGKSYRNVFTSLTFVPFVRIDNYNTSNDVGDVIKPGVYLFSNEVIDKVGMFASLALNKRLERDLYLQFSYRSKIPLLYQLGLEPVATAELFNVTRKTDNFIELGGTSIPLEVSYNLLEFDFALNQQVISQFSSMEFRFAHSRYTSIIETFLNPFTSQFVPGSSDLYLIANDLSLLFTLNAIAPSRTSEINPVGRKIRLRVGRELNKFNGDGEYEITTTGLTPLYKTINFTRVELNWREHLPFFFKNQTITASFRAGTILGPAVDDFFDFYAGGLIGMKGYPFYSLGGNEMAIAGLEYRIPLVQNIDIRFLQFYFDKLYASVYADIGNAWTGKIPTLRQFKTDAGIELRLESFSWYAYPTRLFVNASYGFDEFDRFVSSRNQTVTYGKEWRFYLGMLFGFDLN